MEKAQEIQARLDELQRELHAKVDACDAKYNEAKNAVFAARRTALASLMASKEAPTNFWAQALIALLKQKDQESATMPHFLGPYDEKLLLTYLEDIAVVYNGATGHRITLRFKLNPFFEETELWAEAVEMPVEAVDDEDEEDDVPPPTEESWSFSGVTWKAGHGPQLPDEDEEDEEDEEEGDNQEAPGRKRVHANGGGASSSPSAVQGPSVLEVFGEMPPHPEEDEDLESADDDELADAADEWESEVSDRKMLLRMMELFVHHNPVSALRGPSETDAAVEPPLRKAKME